MPVKRGRGSSWLMRGWRWTPTIWSAPFESCPWARRTGCSARPRWARARSPSSRRCWPVAGRMASTPTPIWSMCCSGSRRLPPARSMTSSPGDGSSASGQTPCDRTSTAPVNGRRRSDAYLDQCMTLGHILWQRHRTRWLGRCRSLNRFPGIFHQRTRVRRQIALFGLERSAASIESSTYGVDSQLSVVAHGSV